MCADVIVAASNAQFGMPETRAGIMGECGIMHRAIRQLPHRIAMAMILTGERLPAKDALAFGPQAPSRRTQRDAGCLASVR